MEFNYEKIIQVIKDKPSFQLMRRLLEAKYVDLYSFEKLLYVSEMLNIVDVLEILEYVDDTLTHGCVLEEQFDVLEFRNRRDEINSLGFYFANYNKSSKTVTLVTSISNFNNDNRVIMYFPDDKVVIKFVSPLNYQKLSNNTAYLESIVPEMIFFRIIADAIECKATDVHFESYKLEDGRKLFPIRYRIGHGLTPRNLFRIDETLNKAMFKELIFNRLALSTIDMEEIAGISASYPHPFTEEGNSLRITINRCDAGYHSTVRILGATKLAERISNLGFKPEVESVLDRMTRCVSGISFVTGPQRTGKNTTIFAILNQMRDKDLQILDFSSPIEYRFPAMQVDYNGNPKSLEALAKAAKKHDADVAILNELPDKHTAQSVYDLVNSSVGVMTTFHINRIWHVCYKLDEYFGENMRNLFTHLRYVVNQKVFVKQCPHCLETYSVSKDTDLEPEVLELLEKFDIKFYKESSGCEKCDYSKEIKGIQPYAEFVIFDEDFRTLLFNCSTMKEMEEAIKTRVRENNSCLEYFVVKDVIEGILHPRELVNLI